MTNETYLFAASIGPVQTFIASARRTRDLWFGSWLLSEVSKAAARALQQQGATLIFPAPDADLTQGSPANIANKVLTIVTGDPSIIGANVGNQAKARLKDLAKEAFDLFARQANGSKITFRRDIADKQIEDLLEYTWVAIEYDASNYAAIRKHLEHLLAARKATRDFGVAPWGSFEVKSSIDGQLEAVATWPKLKQPPTDDDETLKTTLARMGIQPTEHLSGVDLLKRLGEIAGDPPFMSTSHIAARPFMLRFESTVQPLEPAATASLRNLWDAYYKSLPPGIKHHERVPDRLKLSPFGNADGALLYLERLETDQRGTFSSPETLSDVEQHLKAFFQAAKHAGIGELQPYYGILQADGDGMGKVIDHTANAGYQRHQELSRKLVDFASKAKRVIEDHKGAAVYTGGDDVLAFVPLHTIVSCAQTLATAFQTALNNFTNDEGHAPTLSVGVAIVHHLEPLGEALNSARRAEKRAKQVDGKDALAIVVSKRSGSETLIRGKTQTLVATLKTAIDDYRHDRVPEGMAFDLRDVARRLDGPSAGEPLTIADYNHIIFADARRIVKHKQMSEARRKAMVDELEAIEKQFYKEHDHTKRWNAGEYADTLIVARMLADAQDLGEGSLPKEGAVK